MRILYFGIYDPSYSRNRVLINGLHANGVTVDEINYDAKSLAWPLKLILKRFLNFRNKYDFIFVGFPGQEVMPLARLLFPFSNIIFDAFTSHYGGYILDREYFGQKSLRAYYYKFIDWLSCRLADKVLLDTNAHINFFINEFKLPRAKFIRVFVGTDERVMKFSEIRKDEGNIKVHFHGSFIPLQGVDVILDAIKILNNEKITFNLIGKGAMYAKISARIKGENIKNIILKPKVGYSELPKLMADADICLGIFGTTPKTKIVIPNKIYEAIAVGRPVITADTEAIHELFIDGANIILSKIGSAGDLALKIKYLAGDRDLRIKIAKNARRLFENKLQSVIIARDLLRRIN